MSVITPTMFTKKRLCVAIAATLLSANAMAAPIVTVKTTAGDQFTSDRSSDGVSTIEVDNSAPSDGGRAYVTADPAGTYGMNLDSGYGWGREGVNTDTLGASGKYSVRDSFTNRSAVNGIFDFNFTLDAGSASLTAWMGEFKASDPAEVNFSLQILINGIEAWGSEFTFAMADTVTFEQSGDVIDTRVNSNHLYWDKQDITVDMGMVRSGERVDIEYYMKADVSSGISVHDWYDYGGPASFRFGDPYSITGTPIFNEDAFELSDRQPSQDVPAPASLLLLGLGAAGLAANRRRKAKRA